jgi:hypothetical protein
VGERDILRDFKKMDTESTESEAIRLENVSNELMKMVDEESETSSASKAVLATTVETNDGPISVLQLAEILVKSNAILKNYRLSNAEIELSAKAMKLKKSVSAFNKAFASGLALVVSRIKNKDSVDAKDVGNLLGMIRKCSVGEIGAQQTEQYKDLMLKMIEDLKHSDESSSESALYEAMDELGINAPKASIVIDGLPTVPSDAKITYSEISVGFRRRRTVDIKIIVEKGQNQIWIQKVTEDNKDLPTDTIMLNKNGRVKYFDHDNGFVNADILSRAETTKIINKFLAAVSKDDKETVSQAFRTLEESLESNSEDIFENTDESDTIEKQPTVQVNLKDITRPFSRTYSPRRSMSRWTVNIDREGSKVTFTRGRHRVGEEDMTLSLTSNGQVEYVNAESSAKRARAQIPEKLAQVIIKNTVRGAFLDDNDFYKSLHQFEESIQTHLPKLFDQ